MRAAHSPVEDATRPSRLGVQVNIEDRVQDLENNKAGCFTVLAVAVVLFFLISDLGHRIARLEKIEESRTQKSEPK